MGGGGEDEGEEEEEEEGEEEEEEEEEERKVDHIKHNVSSDTCGIALPSMNLLTSWSMSVMPVASLIFSKACS